MSDIEPLQKGEIVVALHEGHWKVCKINKYLPRSHGYKAHPFSRLRSKFGASVLISADQIQSTIHEGDVGFFHNLLEDINNERDHLLHEIDRQARVKAGKACGKYGLDVDQFS